jgi:adenylate kinase family enzyme
LTRIILLGGAGGGKTTLARRLGQRTGAAVVVLDEIWQGHWTADDVPAFRALVEKTHAGEAWISDGNFALATFDLRLPRADLVVWLDRPRLPAAWRAIARTLRPGETHRFADLPKVLRFIRDFDRVNRPRIEAARLKHGPEVPVVRLTSDAEIAAFVDGLNP